MAKPIREVAVLRRKPTRLGYAISDQLVFAINIKGGHVIHAFLLLFGEMLNNL